MASRIGKNISVSIFGQSHSAGIGCVVEGIPAGKKIDLDELQAFLSRRAPGGMPWSTPRKEADLPEFLGGLVNGVTCGAPLAALIRNTNTKKLRLRRAAPRAATGPCRLRGEYEIPRRTRRLGRWPFFRSPYRSLCASRAALRFSCCAMKRSKSVRTSRASRALPMIRSRFMASRPPTFSGACEDVPCSQRRSRRAYDCRHRRSARGGR